MSEQKPSGLLASLSAELAGVVEQVGPAVVRVDDGSRLTATGIIWSADGLIATTSHGVERDEDLSIERGDGSVLPATLVGRDPDTDIALLKVNATGLPAAPLAADGDVKVGHLALALGRPGNSGLQVTLGIVGSRLDSQTNGQPGYLLHTDAVLYPGFSGGPLVDVQGRILGLNNLMYGRGRGIAIGSPIVAQVAQLLLKHGKIQRGYLGVRTQLVAVPENFRQAHGLEQERALLIVQVESGAPAEQGGLMMGDILLTVGGSAIEDVDDLRSQLRAKVAGETVALRLLRGGELRDLNVTLGVEH